MEPRRISVRGFAEVGSAKPNRKQAILKRYKFPDSEESVGRSNYYVKALGIIRRHHKGDSAVVRARLQDLLAQASVEKNPRQKAKLLNNHQAAVDYLRVFGNRPLTIRPGKYLYYIYKNLIVGAHPDLVADENGALVLIKLHLGKDALGGGVCALLLHMMYEAALASGVQIRSTSVECIQSSTGSRIVGPKSGFPAKSVLNQTCQEVLSIWPAA